MRNKRKSNGYWGGGGFTAIPDRLRKSDARISLSHRAKALLFDLICQYNRQNNGDLCLAPTIMRPLGWTSNAGLQAARDELIEKGLLLLSRQGGRNKPSLYALTCYGVDECGGKHDLDARETPTNDYLLHSKN